MCKILTCTRFDLFCLETIRSDRATITISLQSCGSCNVDAQRWSLRGRLLLAGAWRAQRSLPKDFPVLSRNLLKTAH